MKKLLSLLFILLILFSACVSETQTTKLKYYCIELSNEFFADIPECFSQEACFKKAKEEFFSFGKTFFPNEINESLFHLNNSVAKSWFYYNKARKEFHSIRTACESNDFYSLPPKLNNARQFLFNAFTSSDEALQQSLRILVLQKKFLEESDVNSLIDTALFDSYVKVNDNLNSFIAPDLFNKSLVHDYYSKISEFNELTEKKSFKEKILVEDFPFTFLHDLDFSNMIFPASAAKGKFFLALMNKSFSNMSVAAVKQAEMNRFTDFLSEFPAFEFLSLYTRFVSPADSMMKQFSLLLQDNSLAFSQLEESDFLLFADLKDKTIELKQRLNSADFSLVSRSDFNLVMSTANDSLLLDAEFSSNSFNLKKTVYRIETELSSLELNTPEFASRHKKLLLISSELFEVQTGLDSLEDTHLIFLEYCEKISFQAKNPSFILSDYDSKLLSFNSSKFSSSKSFKEKSFYCINTTKLLNSLSSSHSASSDSIPSDENMLSLFLFKPADDINSPDFEFNRQLKKAEETFILLNSIRSMQESALSKKTMDSLKTKLSFFQSLSSNSDSISRQNINDLKDFIDSIESNVSTALKAFLAGSFTLRLMNDKIILGQPFTSFYLLEFTNPFQDINSSFSLSIPLNFTAVDVNSFSSAVRKSFIGNNSLFVDFSFLPFGKTFILINGTDFIDVKEKDELVSVSDSTALFKRTFEVKNPVFINHALIHSSLSYNAKMLSISTVENSFSVNDQALEINIHSLNPFAEFSAYFAVENPLAFNAVLVSESSSGDIKSAEYIYEISSTIPLPKGQQISFVFPLNSQSISSLQLTDFSMNNLEFQWLSDNILSFTLAKDIPPEYPFKIKVLVSFADLDYVNSRLSFLELKLTGFLDIPVKSLSNETHKLLKNLNLLKSKPLSSGLLPDLQNLEKEVSLLEFKVEEFNSQKKNSDDLLNQAKQLLEQERNKLNREDMIKAESFIATAEFFKDNDIESSSLNSFKAIDLINSSKHEIYFDSREHIDSFLSQFSELDEMVFLLNSIEFKKELDSLKEKAIAFTQIPPDANEFSSLQSSFDLLKKKIFDETTTELNKTADELNSLIARSKEGSELFFLIDFLESQLSSIPEKDIIQSHYSLDLTKTDLKSFKNQIRGAFSSRQLNEFNKFFSSVNEKDLSNSLRKAFSFRPLIDEKKNLLDSIEHQLRSFREKLETDARNLTELNNSSPDSLKAKELIEKQEFLKVIALMSLPDSSDKQDYLFLLPLILLIVLILFFKFYFHSSKQKKNPEKLSIPGFVQDF